MSWKDLVAEGAVARRRITSGEVAAALKAAGAAGRQARRAARQARRSLHRGFTGLLTPAAIGGNLLGLRNFEEYRRPAAARRAGDFRRVQRAL